jgi:hypothetical protein
LGSDCSPGLQISRQHNAPAALKLKSISMFAQDDGSMAIERP